MRESIMRRSVHWYLSAWVCALLVFGAFAQPSRANVIYVTTLNDAIGDPSGCSLKDAIFSSRFRNNMAIKSYTLRCICGTDFVPVYVPTSCVAGSGDDTIILPNDAALVLTTITDDADNFVGPTATPMITSTITIEAYGYDFAMERQRPRPRFSGGERRQSDDSQCDYQGFFGERRQRQ